MQSNNRPYLPIGQGYPFLSAGWDPKGRTKGADDFVGWQKQRRNWDEAFTTFVARATDIDLDDYKMAINAIESEY